jgi:hypothetical protein
MVVGQHAPRFGHFGVNQLHIARDARERFHSCYSGNAGELEREALEGILLSSSPQAFRKLFNV